MDIDLLDKQLRETAAAESFTGSILLTRDGQELLAFNAGLVDRRFTDPVDEGTRFGVASVTKMFTATAVMRFVERGRIGLNDALVDLLPEALRPVKADPGVTLHHLLSHTSGIADYYDEEELGPEAYALIWEEIPVSRMRSPRDFLPLFGSLEPKHPLGEGGTHYCNAGFVVLGILLEELSGRSFIETIQDEVFDAAGMMGSGFPSLEEVHPNMATGYMRDEATNDLTTNIYSIPAVGGADGGAYCTARDLDRFLTALSDGTLVKPETFEQMITCYSTWPSGRFGYGYGLVVQGKDMPRVYGHDGEDPGFSARVYRYPDLDINAIALGNEIETTTPLFLHIEQELIGVTRYST